MEGNKNKKRCTNVFVQRFLPSEDWVCIRFCDAINLDERYMGIDRLY